ncbi:MAG TPA: hypothetical protein VIG24_13290 [Acidimicrobiia bacterium]
MPSSYSTTGLELPADGEQTGTWGQTTNTNMQIINRLTSEAGTISLSGTTHTLTLSDGILSDGHYAVLVFGGTPSGTNTVTISPNDAQRVFIVRNSSGESVIMTQGSGGNVTIPDGSDAVVYCDGAGSGAAVVDISSTYLRVENNLSDVASAATALENLGLTATAAELNKLDGATVTTAELNTLDGVDTAGTGFGYVPQGGIIMWSGAISAIPTGWALCDGTSGTPDLTGRFVVHADADSGGTYAPGDTGGADSVTLTEAQIPAHVHGVNLTTSEDGAHTHSYTRSGINNISVNTFPLGAVNRGSTSDTTGEAGAHTHSVTGDTDSTGGGTAHENRPPYYALAYIMKL